MQLLSFVSEPDLRSSEYPAYQLSLSWSLLSKAKRAGVDLRGWCWGDAEYASLSPANLHGWLAEHSLSPSAAPVIATLRRVLQRELRNHDRGVGRRDDLAEMSAYIEDGAMSARVRQRRGETSVRAEIVAMLAALEGV